MKFLYFFPLGMSQAKIDKHQRFRREPHTFRTETVVTICTKHWHAFYGVSK